jgi:asparagine synthase (glutamine-hydrolysing)
MSAIFGVVGIATPEELREMGRRLGHRGRRSAWEEVAPGVFLGQTSRSGREITRTGEFAMVVDGSHALDYGSPDCIAAAFASSRDAADLDRLKAPFTLAAWDEHTQTLWLARDFLGLKPLHYCRLPGGGVAFATEYKALLALHAVPAVADLDALQFMQIYKAVPPGKTLLRGIEPVPPGCVMQIARSGEVLMMDHMPPITLDVRPMGEAAACEELLRRLREATLPMVDGRNRIGLALSGGIDSLSTAFLARSCAPDAQLVAFTAGHGPTDPEVVTARRAMEQLNGTHHMLVVSNEELMTQLPLAVWHLENPIGRSETFQFLALGVSPASKDSTSC